MIKKFIYRIFTVIALASLTFATGCNVMKEELTDMTLGRCLSPMNLKASITNGDEVTFSWDLTKGADKYGLELYSDKEMSKLVKEVELAPEEVPYKVKLEADATYYFRVQAKNSQDESMNSKWAVSTKAINTYAVKPNLYLKVADRTNESLSFTWNADPEVDRLEYYVAGKEDEEPGVKTLEAAEIEAGAATIEGLAPATNYIVGLYYKSANRGEMNLWTRPNTGDAFAVSTVDAFKAAVAAGETKILLKAEGSPYDFGDPGKVDLPNAVEIYGEEGVDGTRPAIYGEFNIPAAFKGGKLYFESVEFNGVKDKYGFAIQLKQDDKIAGLPVEAIVYKNCDITGYSKGLIYEWGQTAVIGELTYDGCTIYNINEEGAGGGDVIDLRGATTLSKLNIVDCTIYQGMRTFVRFDANVIAGDINVSNNTLMNLCFVENNNNGGFFGIKTKPSSLRFANNLVLYMEGNASIIGPAAANLTAADAGLTCSNNFYYSLNEEKFFNEKVSESEALAGSGKKLAADPCFNAKGGQFNLTDADALAAKVGAGKWLTPYVEEPEDLTLPLIDAAHTWDFSDARYFVGDITKSKVRDGLMMGVTANSLKVAEGVMVFNKATEVSRKGLPVDGYLAFKVDRPGSVYIRPCDVVNERGEYVRGNHLVVSVGDVNGTVASVKGGAAMNVGSDKAQKILINDITEESIVYVYASGNVGISGLAWAFDTDQVNTALATPEPGLNPATVTQGEAVDVEVSWAPVANAGGYSVVFNGKSYPVEDGETSYMLPSNVIKFLDAGGYMISVYANPGENDIYNTQSSAGKVALTVAAAGGSASGETIVSSLEDLVNSIGAGKQNIKLAYSDTPYEFGTLALTTPLRLTGEEKGGKYPTVRGNFSISGQLGALVLRDLNLDGTGAAGSIIVEDKASDDVVADTVAMYNCVIRNHSKALYDNSGKKNANVNYVIFDDIQVYDTSNGSDFIDMRAGTYNNVLITNSTFANSARTFFRTDTGNTINTVIVRNNTFYKVATNSTSKDNNGLFHVRSVGIGKYEISNNLFYSIKITETPGHANGFPKFVNKHDAARKPTLIANNYFYNIHEEDPFNWWTVNCSREEGIANGGVVLSEEPCRAPESYDFTLTNIVAQNSNIGDPRWNPLAGRIPTSEITVGTVEDMLTAISAGKTTITLNAGTYDFTALAEVPEVSGGVLTVSTSLNLIGKAGATVYGGFKFMGDAVRNFSASGISFIGTSAAAKIGNMLEVGDASVDMAKVSLKNCNISSYGNRLFYMSQDKAKLQSLEIASSDVHDMGTSGDFIDVRKGGLSALNVTGNVFANGIRTFLRMDADVVCETIVLRNNTFYNTSSVDSKDNNGILHVRAAVATEKFIVANNIFAAMHRAKEAPSNAKGYPRLKENGDPTLSGNQYYDIDTAEPYSWWNKIDEAAGIANGGAVLTESPFAGDPAGGNFAVKAEYAAYGARR